jgi:hypothetical protein
VARDKTAAVALVASAALAATVPPEVAQASEAAADEPTVEGLTADLSAEKVRVAALEAELEEVRRRTVELEAAVIEANDAGLRMRERFDAAWREREAEIAARVAPAAAPTEPLTARRYRAVGSLRCHLRGAPITVADGALIPDGVDLSTLPSEAFEEAR